MLNKKFYFLLVILLLSASLFGRIKPGAKKPLAFKPGLSKGTATAAPAWQLSWIGAGFFTDYTISNTGQSGYFEPPPGWEGYDGTFPTGMGQGNGRTGEFPKGTNQFYVWGAGLWVGARSPHFDTADDKLLALDALGINENSYNKMGVVDSVFDEQGDFVRTRRAIKNVRVSATSYYSDLSAISQLWQSNQIISSTIDQKDPQYKGELLFGQKNKNIEDFQEPWSFFLPSDANYYNATADTIYRLDHKDINSRRHELLLKNPSLDPDQILLDPFKKDRYGNVHGDIVSDEDSYSVFGDYIEERDGSFIWSDGYDIRPLGVRITQRTYSWVIDDYIYLNYKIKNMNDFPLYDVFVGYFMDNDVGDATDDMIGFDRELNLGYSYDSNKEEQGWATSAGYVGAVFVETPRKYYQDGEVHTGNDGVDNDGDGLEDESDEWEQIGLTGFQTWIRSDLGKSEGFGGDVDDQETDHLKYFEMALQDTFEVYEEAQDVRQLTASGPFVELQPGEEINVTIAIVGGESLNDLKKNTMDAVQKYENGYIGPEAPPSPELTAQPGHEKVYLSWDDFPESAIDPYTGAEDFAGYRVYRSQTGLQDDWELLAEYDLQEDSTKYDASIKYKIGKSNVNATLDKVLTDDDIETSYDYDTIEDIFKKATYNIEFVERTLDISGKPVDTLCISVYDVTKGQLLTYNLDALTEGVGFTVYDGKYAKSYGPIYVSGSRIYFNGMYISIENGEYQDLDNDGYISETEKNQQILHPEAGDVFEVKTFTADDIGDQTGIQYTYKDEDLTDGISYYYSVTSFDRGDAPRNIPSLESSKYQNITEVRPQHIGLEYEGEPKLSSAIYTGEGNTTGQILRGISDYKALKGHTYEFRFFKTNPFKETSDIADYGIVIDKDITPESINNQDLGQAIDSTHWVIDLSKSTILPGTVTLQFDGASTESISDHDSTGALTGNGNLVGIINYGTGEIVVSHSNGENLSSDLSALANFKCLNIVLKNQSTKKYSGKLRFNSSATALQNIYEVSEAIGSDTISHGFNIASISPTLNVDSTAWSLGTDAESVFIPEITAKNTEPFDYIVTFPEEGSHSAFEEFKIKYGDPDFTQTLPWKVENLTLDIESRSWNPKFPGPEDNVVEWQLNNKDNLARVLHEDTRADSGIAKSAFDLKFKAIFEDEDLGISDTLAAPEVDDTLYVFTSRPIGVKDKFELTTSNMFSKKEEITLKDVRVVPNPYYIRAAWDTDQYTQHLNFYHLPSGTTEPVHVRIFNLAGDLVVHMKKNNIVEANETADEAGTLSWNLRNFNNLKVTSGLYIYHIETKIDGKKKTYTGKFCIVMGA